MTNHIVYVTDPESELYEYHTESKAPNVGDYVELPLGPEKSLGRYYVVDVIFMPKSPDQILYYVHVIPA